MDTLCYHRVSDPRQATEDKVSLAVQDRATAAMAAQLGRRITPEGTFVDAGVSGATAQRPAFQRLVAYCQTNPRPKKDGLVLVYRDDRWGRFEDPDEAAHWTWLIGQAGWKVRFAQMDSDNDEVSPFLRTIGRMSGRAERRKIQDRSRMGMRGVTDAGFWVNREPFGFRRLAIDKATGAERTLSPGQRKGDSERLKLTPGPADEVAFVQWLFETYATGAVSVMELFTRAPERYPRQWTWSHVNRMLKNPVYAGDLVSGVKAGDVRTLRDAFPALVDRDTFDRVQEILQRNRKETSPVRYAYPLTGLIHCATCGGAMVGGGRAGPRAGDDPQANWFYRDSGPNKHPQCPGPLVTMLRREIEPKVIDAIAGVIDQHDLAPRLARAFDRILATTDVARSERRAELVRSQQHLEAKKARLVIAVGEGTLLRAEAEPQLRQVREQLDRVTGDLERMRFDVRRHARVSAERDRLVAMTTDFRALAVKLEGAELRELLRPWIERATIEKGTRRVTMAIRRVPAMPLLDTLPTSADQRQQADTITVTFRLKSRSEWARLREAEKRARKNANPDNANEIAVKRHA